MLLHAVKLVKLSTDPNLAKLSPADQEQTLKALEQKPTDATHLANLQKTISNGFQKMDDATKTRVLDQATKYAGTPISTDLSNLVSNGKFAGMSAADQNKTLNVFENTKTAEGKRILDEIVG